MEKHFAPEAAVAVGAYVTGMGVAARRTLGGFLGLRNIRRAFFINAEAISASDKAREALSCFLGSGSCMLAIDESTKIRSGDAKLTQWLCEVASIARARRILTGMPAPRAPTDIYHQYSFLDPGVLKYGSFWVFRNHFAVMSQVRVGTYLDRAGNEKDRMVWVDVAYRNQEELAAMIEPWSFRALKKDYLPIEKTYLRPRTVEPTDEQRRMYKEFLEQATAQLDNGEWSKASSRVVQALRLHQVCCGHITNEAGETRYLKQNRTRALLEELDEVSGKAVIWCAYDADVRIITDALVKEYGQGSVVRFWGGNAKTRHEDEARWKSDAGCRWMISTQAAGGRGNNWVQSSHSIYYSNTYDLEMRAQSEDRTHRDGQVAKACTYRDLIIPGTIDERFLEVLRSKLDMSALLMGDGYREWVQWRA
jgi:SNF2 family DNA or RNA helicase